MKQTEHRSNEKVRFDVKIWTCCSWTDKWL